jgi:hypothetical protein
MKPRYVTRYRYGDTEKFAKFSIQYGRDTFKNIKFKIKYMNAQYINITKIDDKLTFKLLKMSKQVAITYTILKGHH